MKHIMTWTLFGCETTMGLPSSDVCRIPMCNGISAENISTCQKQNWQCEIPQTHNLIQVSVSHKNMGLQKSPGFQPKECLY